MSRAKKRADRLREEVPIIQVLADYGYAVRDDGGDREQQFSCDLHGDGSDTKPSARVYPASQSFFCFACGRTRDLISTAREKEGLDFWGAIKVLEERYRLPPLPWDDDDQAEAEAAKKGKPRTLTDQIRATLEVEATWEAERARCDRFLTLATADRDLPLSVLLGFWEAFDRVCHGVESEEWPEAKAKAAVAQIRGRALEAMRAPR